MIGLEGRGKIADPATRGTVARLIYESLDREYRYRLPTLGHQMIWGVPCGPTLSMVNPPMLQGISTRSRVERVPVVSRPPDAVMTSTRSQFCQTPTIRII